MPMGCSSSSDGKDDSDMLVERCGSIGMLVLEGRPSADMDGDSSSDEYDSASVLSESSCVSSTDDLGANDDLLASDNPEDNIKISGEMERARISFLSKQRALENARDDVRAAQLRKLQNRLKRSKNVSVCAALEGTSQVKVCARTQAQVEETVHQFTRENSMSMSRGIQELERQKLNQRKRRMQRFFKS